MVKILRILLTGLVRFFSLLPLKAHYRMADFIAWVMHSVVEYRREVVAINMGRSFTSSEYYYDTLVRFCREYYRHMAEIVVEAVWFAGADRKRMYESGLLTLMNYKLLENLYESSPSVVIFYSHCGNWELMGGIPYSRCADADAVAIPESRFRCVYKALSNKVWDEFFQRNRTSLSESRDVMLESSHLMRYMLGHRQEKLIYFLNIDQCPYVASVDIGEFMHQPTRAFLDPAKLAHKFGFAVLYMSFERVEQGRYELTFNTICENAAEMDPKDIIRGYYDNLEAEIRRHPENWLWSHKRWK